MGSPAHGSWTVMACLAGASRDCCLFCRPAAVQQDTRPRLRGLMERNKEKRKGDEEQGEEAVGGSAVGSVGIFGIRTL